MAFIKYDSDYISNNIIPYVDDAIELLNDANDYTGYSIPSDFSYKEYLNGVSSKIAECKSELNNFKYATTVWKTNFDNVDFVHREKIGAIDDTLLKRRVSLIEKSKNV